MLPERGEGCRCKGKTPKTFMYVCMLAGKDVQICGVLLNTERPRKEAKGSERS